MRTVFLYTIGPGTPLFERYGHTLLCVRDGDVEASGTCTDYGVANATSASDLIWGTLRGKPQFVATAVTEQLALDTFRGEGRAIERQRLPLDEAQTTQLSQALEAHMQSGWAYAYHPRESNCSSHPRDLIDAATQGAFQREALARTIPPDPDLATYRSQFEAGLSGHLFELSVGALISGTPADPIPDGWQTMYQPERLRDGAATYLGAPVEQVAARIDHPLPTSPSIGRASLLLLGLGLYLLARRTTRMRAARPLIGAVLGSMALFLHALALISVWPEFSRNWVLLLLWPTDLALPWLRERALLGYAKLRLGVCATLALAELVGVIHQPILPVALLAGLPMLGLLLALRAPHRDAAPAAVPAS